MAGEWCMQGDAGAGSEAPDLTGGSWGYDAGATTHGQFLKICRVEHGVRAYYKANAYSMGVGFYGGFTFAEVIASRFGRMSGFACEEYTIAYAKVRHGGRTLYDWVCRSEDFRRDGKARHTLGEAMRKRGRENASPEEFLKASGMWPDAERMLLFDYLIRNLDRHEGNIYTCGGAMCKLFDHNMGLYATVSDRDAGSIRWDDDPVANNFVGGPSLIDNLKLIENPVALNRFKVQYRELLVDGLPASYTEARWPQVFDAIAGRWGHAKRMGYIVER